MSNYIRLRIPGGTYFFTLVTYRRAPFLCQESSRDALRDAIVRTRRHYPFEAIAWVLLPDHLHCVWRLPEGDSDYSTRWRLIKTYFSKSRSNGMGSFRETTRSRQRRRECPIWQRRFWEHVIRGDDDLRRHIDYIHFNPVKHGLVAVPDAWGYSTFNRYVENGLYPATGWSVGDDVLGMDLA